MARTANPYTKVAKRISALQAKANKLNAEIAGLADLVASESKKTTAPKVKTTAKKAPVRKALKTPAKAKTAPKKAPKAKNPKK